MLPTLLKARDCLNAGAGHIGRGDITELEGRTAVSCTRLVRTNSAVATDSVTNTVKKAGPSASRRRDLLEVPRARVVTTRRRPIDSSTVDNGVVVGTADKQKNEKCNSMHLWGLAVQVGRSGRSARLSGGLSPVGRVDAVW